MKLLTKFDNCSKQKNSHRGFTLMEIMIVVITLGVISSLALSNYNKIVEQGYCRNAQMNLIAIHSATQIHFIKHPSYVLTGTTLTEINTDLKLNIIDPHFTYTHVPNGIVSYNVVAARTGGPIYSCRIDGPAPIASATNPSCTNADLCTSVIEP